MDGSERNGVPPEAIPADPDEVPREAPGPAASDREALERTRPAPDVERIDGPAADDVERE